MEVPDSGADETTEDGRENVGLSIKDNNIPSLTRRLPSFLLSNARSLLNKLEDLSVSLNDNKVDIAIISETWFSYEHPPECTHVNGFNLFSRCRTEGRGGGVAIYVKDFIPTDIINFIEVPTELECLWVLVKPFWLPRSISNIAICAVYNPPASLHQEMLCKHIIDSIDKVNTRYPNAGICVLGDFNRCDISNVVHGTLLNQLVTQPTRGEAILDLIITNLKPYYQDPRIEEPLAMSDHNTVLWSPHDHTPINTKTILQFRPFKDSEVRSFGQWISSHPWTEVFDAHDIQSKVNTFYQTLQTRIDLHFPMKSVVKHNSDKEWVTPQIKSLIKRRQQAFHSRNMILYRKLRNRVNRLCTKARKRHYVHKIHVLKKENPARWHMSLRNILNVRRNVSVSVPSSSPLTDKEIAAAINRHFSDIVNQLPCLDFESLPSYLPSPSKPPHIHSYEVYEILKRLDARRSCGPDNISPKIVKTFAVELSDILAHIFNCSLEEGRVPKQWKEAVISPIPKKSPATVENLRPISLTSVFIKTFESFITKWVLQDIDKVLDPNQYGSRKGRSSVHYLISMIDSILSDAETPKTIQTVLLTDFSKAFDRIDHSLLIRKLLTCGVRTSILPWICSFLNDRTQCVRYRGVTSCWEKIASGVPQGTKLGPVLFLVYVNDAMQFFLNRWKYVDDLTLKESRLFSEQSSMQTAINQLDTWSSENCMSLNEDKCKLICISFMKDPPPSPVILLNGKAIEYTEDACILGVWISADMKWGKHVTTIIKKASSRLFWLKKLKRSGVCTEDLCAIYLLYVRPVIEYAVPVWHAGLTTLQSQQLERIQKRALRIILGNNYTSYADALSTCNLCTLKARRESLCLKFAKSLMNSPTFRPWLPPTRNTVHNMDLKGGSQLSLPFIRSDRYRNSAIPYFSKLLNSVL